MPPAGHHLHPATQSVHFGLQALQSHFQPVAVGQIVSVKVRSGGHRVVEHRHLIHHQQIQIAVVFQVKHHRPAPDAVIVQAQGAGVFAERTVLVLEIRIGHRDAVGVQVAVGHKQIQVAVVVEIGEVGPPANGQVRQAEPTGLVQKRLARPLTHHELVEPNIGEIVVQPPVVVDVAHGGTHRINGQIEL